MYLILSIYLLVGVVWGMFMTSDPDEAERVTGAPLNAIFVISVLLWVLFVPWAIISAIRTMKESNNEHQE